MQNIDKKVISVVADHFGKRIEDIKIEYTIINDLGADSLDAVELVMLLEDEFSIEIPDEDYEKITTVKEIIEYVCKARGTIPRFESEKGK